MGAFMNRDQWIGNGNGVDLPLKCLQPTVLNFITILNQSQSYCLKKFSFSVLGCSTSIHSVNMSIMLLSVCVCKVTPCDFLYIRFPSFNNNNVYTYYLFRFCHV